MTISIVPVRRVIGVLLVALGVVTWCGPVPAVAQAPIEAVRHDADRTPTVFDEPALVQQYQSTITPEDLSAYLYFYASDFFEGRETTTHGQRMAAYYLASQYRKLGLAPLGTVAPDDPRSLARYMQPFTVYSRRLEAATLRVAHGGTGVDSVTFSRSEQGGAYLAFGAKARVTGPVVFAGYGIADDGLRYNDYGALEEAGVDLMGRWVMVLDDEPMRDASTSLLPTEDGTPSTWTTRTFSKYRAALVHGAQGLLVVSDVGPRTEKPVRAQAADQAQRIDHVGSLSLRADGPARPYPPMYRISSALANQILAPSGRTVDDLKQAIDTTLDPVTFRVEGTNVTSTLTHGVHEAETENVLAYIEGTDPALKDEVVVLSSHYDHIGMEPVDDGEDGIYNGADDDGSGNVTMLEIAEAFMAAKRDGYGPRRSVLFLNVSGEEKGLLGSEFYTDTEPLIPLTKTVANLNIDMIGRHDPARGPDSNYVYIIGSHLISEELHEANARVNDVTGTRLDLDERYNTRDDPNQHYRRSDHWNFGKHGVPFIFFFTGTHEDYHRPSDEADKIDYERMARIGRLIFGTAWQLANQDDPPAVSGEGFN